MEGFKWGWGWVAAPGDIDPRFGFCAESSQDISQEDHHELGGDVIESAGTEVAQVVRALELPVPFFDRRTLAMDADLFKGLGGLVARHERPVVVTAVGILVA